MASDGTPNWLKLQAEYARGGISQRKLAEKHGVSYSTLRDRAARDSWSVTRSNVRSKIGAKTEQKLADAVASDAASLGLDEARHILASIARDGEQDSRARIAALKLAGDWGQWAAVPADPAGAPQRLHISDPGGPPDD